MPINRWCSQITVCVSLSFCFSNLVVPQRQGSQLINIWLCYWARHSLGRTPCSAEEWGERGEIWAQWTESKCLCREDEQRDTVFQLNACHLQHTAAIPSIKGQQTLEEFWKCKSRCCHPVHTRWVLLELSSPKLYMAYYSVEKKIKVTRAVLWSQLRKKLRHGHESRLQGLRSLWPTWWFVIKIII